MASKILTGRSQRTLLELALKPGNDACADCKARNPRWASHNLGIFICVECASIHRKIGTHITKVKSLSLDSWSKEQVEVMKEKGNIRSNLHYNPDESKHPIPVGMTSSERASDLEMYIRDKYEFKRFVRNPHSIAAALLGPSRSAASARISRSMSTSPSAPSLSTASPTSATFAQAPSPSVAALSTQQRSASQPMSASQSYQAPVQPQIAPPAQLPAQAQSSTWNDLVGLQQPTSSSSFPLQYSASLTQQVQPSPFGAQTLSPQGTNFGQQVQSAPLAIPRGASPNPFTGLTGSGFGVSPNFGVNVGGMGVSPSAGHGTSPGLNMSAMQGGMGASPSFAQGQSGFGTANPYGQTNGYGATNPFAQQTGAYAGSPVGAAGTPYASPATPLGAGNPFQQLQQQQIMQPQHTASFIPSAASFGGVNPSQPFATNPFSQQQFAQPQNGGAFAQPFEPASFQGGQMGGQMGGLGVGSPMGVSPAPSPGPGMAGNPFGQGQQQPGMVQGQFGANPFGAAGAGGWGQQQGW